MRIYLSGNMTPNVEFYNEWTNKLKNILSYGKNLNVSIAKNKEIKYFDDKKFIVRHDLARLKRCDAVVINLGVTDLSHHLTGAVVEIYEAYKSGIPVYAFCSDNALLSTQSSSPWIEEFITKFFYTEEDLVNFLRYDDNMEVDFG